MSVPDLSPNVLLQLHCLLPAMKALMAAKAIKKESDRHTAVAAGAAVARLETTLKAQFGMRER